MGSKTLNYSPDLLHQLENLVGAIHLKTSSDFEAAPFLLKLDNWLARSGWDKHLRVLTEYGAQEHSVAFIPGEHQSNPEVRLTFREAPEFERVQHRLEHWLYELM